MLNSSLKMFGCKYSLYKLSSIVILTVILVLSSILINLTVFLYVEQTPEVFLQPVQILESGIVSNLNVLQYFMVLVFQKVVAYISLALFISAISMLCKKYINSFIVSFATITLFVFVGIILNFKINLSNIFSLNTQILMCGRLIPLLFFVYLGLLFIGVALFIFVSKFYPKLSKYVYWR